MVKFRVSRLASVSVLARSPGFAENASLRRNLKSVLLCGALVMAGIAQAGSLTVTASGASAVLSLNGNGVPDAYIFTPTISANTQNYNVRSAAVAAGWDQVKPLKATVTIAPGVYVGSSSTGSAAFDTGVSFPIASSLSLTIGSGAYIVGAGGPGGSYGSYGGNAGGAGGPALKAQSALSVTNNGTIGGGGGGGGSGGQWSGIVGGGGGGGGGAGFTAGAGGSGSAASGYPQYYGNAGGTGTLTAGGAYGCQCTGGGAGSGGAGGSLGSAGAQGGAGSAGPGGVGGTAGAAVTGNANITWTAIGTRLGTIN